MVRQHDSEFQFFFFLLFHYFINRTARLKRHASCPFKMWWQASHLLQYRFIERASVIPAKPVYIFFSHRCLEFEASHALVLYRIFQHQQLLWFKTNTDSEYNYSQYLITQLTFEAVLFHPDTDASVKKYTGASIAPAVLLKLNESNFSSIQAFKCEYSQLKWFY
jgi:hypothetical protein